MRALAVDLGSLHAVFLPGLNGERDTCLHPALMCINYTGVMCLCSGLAHAALAHCKVATVD